MSETAMEERLIQVRMLQIGKDIFLASARACNGAAGWTLLSITPISSSNTAGMVAAMPTPFLAP